MRIDISRYQSTSSQQKIIAMVLLGEEKRPYEEHSGSISGAAEEKAK